MSVFNRDKASTDQSSVTAAEVKQGQLFEGKKGGVIIQRVHLKMKILSAFIHPHVIPYLKSNIFFCV